MTAREDAMAASYAADCYKEQYEEVWDIAEKMAGVLGAMLPHLSAERGYYLRSTQLAELQKQVEDALAAWKKYSGLENEQRSQS